MSAARLPRARKPKPKKPVEPTGISLVDDLADQPAVTIADYLQAVSEYVKRSSSLDPDPKKASKKKKAAQIRLSNALARALTAELKAKLPGLKREHVGERTVSGALRTARADVSEIHPIDGLRLAIELKPVNLAVGRAIWNRFGDIRTFAVNLHLKFPFCIVGGVLVIPTYEEIGTKEAKEALDLEEDPEIATGEATADGELSEEPPLAGESEPTELKPGRRSTLHLIERAVARLVRAGGRKTEGDAPHLLEAIAVIAYDPDTGALDPDLPPAGSRLRWDEFIADMATAYLGRFEN